MTAAGRTVDVLVKIDVGFHRCGIDPDPRRRCRSSRLSQRCRVCTCAGCCRTPATRITRRPPTTCERSPRTKRGRCVRWPTPRARPACEIDELSAGATPTARFSLEQDGLTEYRAGNYVYFDRTQVGLGAATFDDCALTVLATVVSKPAADRIILDCGSKTLTSDGARGFSPLPGHGAVFRDRRDCRAVPGPTTT